LMCRFSVLIVVVSLLIVMTRLTAVRVLDENSRNSFMTGRETWLMVTTLPPCCFGQEWT